ncbi:recombinase family protein [Nocardia sp. BSTN01]|uniref:recombinase family protein n=1 Tax=Nocardia sp. BSTN01 TaxID=2783665 RepID=UPI0035CCEF99
MRKQRSRSIAIRSRLTTGFSDRYAGERIAVPGQRSEEVRELAGYARSGDRLTVSELYRLCRDLADILAVRDWCRRHQVKLRVLVRGAVGHHGPVCDRRDNHHAGQRADLGRPVSARPANAKPCNTAPRDPRQAVRRERRPPTITGRVSALRRLVLQAPAPVVADALGIHSRTNDYRHFLQ